MLESGYVLDYRSVLSWEWYKDANTSRLFRHLVLTVNYEDRKWRGKVIKRGQRVTSYQQLSSELNISVQGIRTAINHLKSTGEITYLGTRENSVITVNNYDTFQCLTHESTDGQQTSNRPLTDHQQQCNTDKESNTDNTDKKSTTPVSPATETIFEQVRESFIENCPSLPKPNASAKWTPARKKAVRDKKISVEEFTAAFKKIEQSDFLTGRTGSWHGCSIDWILKPSNWQKIIEGNYDNRTEQKKESGREYSFDIDEYERTSFYDNLKR